MNAQNLQGNALLLRKLLWITCRKRDSIGKRTSTSGQQNAGAPSKITLERTTVKNVKIHSLCTTE